MASIKWKLLTILIIKVDKQLSYYILFSFSCKVHAIGCYLFPESNRAVQVSDLTRPCSVGNLIPYFSMHAVIFFILKFTPLKLWDGVIFIRALEIIALRFRSFHHFTFRNSLLSMNFSWNHLISPRVPDPVSQFISGDLVLLWAYWNTTILTLRVKFRGNTRSKQGCHVFCIYPLCSWYSTLTWL